MVSPPSNPAPSDIPTTLTPSSSQASEIPGMDTEQMFRLIDSILPFEACLYYQFLPLALEGRHLKLGMVAPQDSSALDYVRHILAYLNCSLKTEVIDAEVHQSMLSAYLNYTHTSSASRTKAPKKDYSKKDYKAPRSEQPTLILDDDSQVAGGEPDEPSDSPPTWPQNNPTWPQKSTEDSSESPLASAQVPPSASPLPPKESSSSFPKETPPATALTPVPNASPSAELLPPLEIKALYLSRPIDFLATLSPQQLLQELLGRVLMGGIGRLYFERQVDKGRILWSQDGVLQSVLEGLSLPVFQSVIIELKRFVHLPLLPVIQPKQVEIERSYQQEGLLLRLRVMPGTHGEEATLQVLRGVALKFYQRQQLDKLSQDALKLAQQLQRKLYQIRDCSRRYPMELEVIPALSQLVQGLDKQLEALADLQVNQHSE